MPRELCLVLLTKPLRCRSSILRIEVKEPYPELAGGQNIRRARGPAQFNHYIYVTRFSNEKSAQILSTISHLSSSLISWYIGSVGRYSSNCIYKFLYLCVDHCLELAQKMLIILHFCIKILHKCEKADFDQHLKWAGPISWLKIYNKQFLFRSRTICERLG